MKDSNTDLFDPRSTMESDFPPGELATGSGSDSDFAFAFNDRNFSDRVLRIEIIPDFPEIKSDGEGCISVADWARNRKRRREEIKNENSKSVSFIFLQFLSFSCYLLKMVVHAIGVYLAT